jgi:hypothetical protein
MSTGAMSASSPDPRRAFLRGLAMAWDNAGLVIGLNLCWILLVIAVGFGLHLAASLAGWQGGSPFHTGLRSPHPEHAGPLDPILDLALLAAAGAAASGPAGAISRRLRLESAGLSDCLESLRRDGASYAALTILFSLVVGGCLLCAVTLATAGPLIVIAPLPLYAALFWLLAAPYQFALVILERRRPLAAIRRSALLVLDNPFYSLVAGLLSGAALLALFCSVIGVFVTIVPVAAALSQAITVEVLRKYSGDPDPQGDLERYPYGVPEGDPAGDAPNDLHNDLHNHLHNDPHPETGAGAGGVGAPRGSQRRDPGR